ncbi:MAG: GMC family oxidoreductase N-terminal domain-containing protein, partial [Terracidiphilus sp.]
MSRPQLIVLLALVSCAWGQIGGRAAEPAPDPLLAVHVALFSSFLPIDEVKKDDAVYALFAAARDGMWASAGSDSRFRSLLAPFQDVRGFGSACGVAAYVHTEKPMPFAVLTQAQRNHVLWLLETCDVTALRQLSMTLRNLYVAKGYGSIQEPLAGVRLNVHAPHAWIVTHTPALPPTRLRFDRAAGEVLSRDGAVDYLIVGSGPAGSVLAHELRRGGKRVVLLERGSFVVPGAMETRQVDALLDARTTDDGGIIIHNGMAVGGGTQVNVDLGFAPTLPAIQTRLQRWRDQGSIDAAVFSKQRIAAAYTWVERTIGTRRLAEGEINANNRVLWDGARAEGLHPKVYELNTYAPGRSPYPVTDKRSAESQLLLDALEDQKDPLSIIPDADVRRVLFANNNGERRAIGVEARMRKPFVADGVIADPSGLGINAGETFVIHARTVILAAGALGSPTVLLRSGVENDRIGRGVILHPSMPVLGKFDRTIDALKGTEASVYVDDRLVDRGYAFESMSAQPAYAALMSPGLAEHTLETLRSFRHLAGFGVMLVDTPSAENRLVLDDRGEPQIHYEISVADKARFRQGIAEAVRIMFRAGAREVYLPTTEDVTEAG